MKKTLKIVTIFTIMIFVLVILTACGENKLIATKSMTAEEDGLKGEAKVEVTFENDEATHIDMVMDLEDEEQANQLYQVYTIMKSMSEEDPEEGTAGIEFDIKQDGKKITVSTNNIEMLDQEENLKTKEEIKAYFDEEGFTIK